MKAKNQESPSERLRQAAIKAEAERNKLHDERLALMAKVEQVTRERDIQAMAAQAMTERADNAERMAAMLIELYLVVVCWRRGEAAGPNPWGSKTLEWQVPTPVPHENFAVMPVVTSDPYGYGEESEFNSIGEETSGQ